MNNDEADNSNPDYINHDDYGKKIRKNHKNYYK